ncbi:hypothetical protein OQ252_03945 [Acetobacter farinalis]|uniref:Uncharacterized protein n=1 Tax=Acetobacter farinalis TaxID=1260984 RepID=A0ABT3Q5I7_9PROT|nr:hypothetical protein [Acetobacter farinalis]MCX2560559.1 hypothetical protein [Acetobacter farinalis]NHO29300.1 hypothetical protein [Acetobacter farinalis]
MSKKLPPIPPVPAKVAAAINRTTQLAINEAISKKLYNCAPTTVPGSRRIFQELDILGLRVFFHLCDVGFNHNWAGRMACNVRMWASSDVPAGFKLVEVRFPHNFSYPSGIGIFEDKNGNLVDYKGQKPIPDHELARSSISIAVSGHLEDIRMVFQQLIEEGVIAPVSRKSTTDETSYAYDVVKDAE